jgi:hypothetical protein
MLAESALGSALDKVTPIKLAGKFWRVVATSSLLGLVRGENGLPEVTRIHPNLLFAGGPRRVGGRYTPIEGPDTLYLASSERAANVKWKARRSQEEINSPAIGRGAIGNTSGTNEMSPCIAIPLVGTSAPAI